MKVQILPKAGDTLLIGTYRKGKGMRKCEKGREYMSAVAAVYDDQRVKSKEGDVFSVRLLNAATDKLPARWVTVE